MEKEGENITELIGIYEIKISDLKQFYESKDYERFNNTKKEIILLIKQISENI